LAAEFDDDGAFEPWSTVHIDHVTRLPKTSRGNQHIVTATCRMTHATVFVPVKTLSAGIGRRAPAERVLDPRLPRKLVADRSTSWRNQL
jgi:hypothetical protein